MDNPLDFSKHFPEGAWGETKPIPREVLVEQARTDIASMRPENVRTWVAALESGKFLQGTKHLRTYGDDELQLRFCCLGVYCEVVIIPREGISWKTIEPSAEIEETIPESLIQDREFAFQVPFFMSNDGGGTTGESHRNLRFEYPQLNFLQIAALIREARPDCFQEVSSGSV